MKCPKLFIITILCCHCVVALQRSKVAPPPIRSLYSRPGRLNIPLRQALLTLRGKWQKQITPPVAAEIRLAFEEALRPAMTNARFSSSFYTTKTGLAGMLETVVSNMELCSDAKVRLVAAADMLQKTFDTYLRVGALFAFPGDDYVLELTGTLINAFAWSVRKVREVPQCRLPQHSQLLAREMKKRAKRTFKKK